MEHGELCVMISGELWMQVWPANNWVSLETVSVYYCCFTITAIKSFVSKSITGFQTIWKCVIQVSLSAILQMQLLAHLPSMVRELDPFG